MQRVHTAIIAVALSLFLGGISIAFAADATGQFQFQPIVSVPLPGSGAVGSHTTLAEYVNGVFRLAIGIATILGVIYIMVDGFVYMTSEAVGKKSDALGGIRSALFGLLLLLLSTTILYVIDPNILNLNALQSDLNTLEGSSGGAGLNNGAGVSAPSNSGGGGGLGGDASTNSTNNGVPGGVINTPTRSLDQERADCTKQGGTLEIASGGFSIADLFSSTMNVTCVK